MYERGPGSAGTKGRRERIHQVANVIKKLGSANKRKFYAEFSFNYGISSRKLDEYIETLEDMGIVKQSLDGETIEYMGD